MRLVEWLLVLVLGSILTAVEVPDALQLARRAATKQSMSNIVSTVQLYEAETGALPATLASLVPNYFAAGTTFRDSFGVAYTYTVATRRICSTNAVVGCLIF